MALRYFLLFSLFSVPGFGQQNRIIDRNTIGWYVYNGDHKLSKRWELHTEYQWRRVELIRTWQQSLARMGLAYKLTKQVKLGGGYTFFTTFPYGDFPVADAGVPAIENRTHQDIQISSDAGRFELSHRFRLEQRWLGQGDDTNPRRVTDWEYQNRVRYQISGTVPLKGVTVDDGEWYVNFFDELFIGFGRNVGQNVFNQNRLSGGLGYQVSSGFKIELNYLNQITQHPENEPVSNKPVFEINNGFRLNIQYDLDFSGK